jgi:uncharacterized protein (TIRG00374 family)
MKSKHITNNKRKGLLIFQWLVAASALFLIVKQIDFNNFSKVIKDADLRFLAAAYLAALLGFLPAALRWKKLIDITGLNYSLFSTYRFYIIGSFFGLAMPGSIGGDGARIWLCNRDSKIGVAMVTATVLVERTMGVIALFLILSAGVIINPAPGGFDINIFVLSMAGLGVLSVILAPHIIRYIAKQKNPFVKNNSHISNLINKIVTQLEPIKDVSLYQLLYVLILSIFFQLFDILVTYLLSCALNIKISFFVLFVAMPIVYLVTVLPISPGGLGVREGALMFVLGQFSVIPDLSAILALAVFFNRVLIAITGGVIFVLCYTRKNITLPDLKTP